MVTDWIKQLGPCSINRSIKSMNEIIKFVNLIEQEHVIVVIANLNYTRLYTLLCFENIAFIKFYILFNNMQHDYLQTLAAC